MRFADKIVLITSLCSGVLFTAGGSFMILQSFDGLLKSTIAQHVNTHMLERYALETKLIPQQIEDNHLDEQVTLYGAQLISYESSSQKQIALFTDKKKKLYSNIPESLLNSDYSNLTNGTYILKKFNQQVYMLIGSDSQIGPNIYRMIGAYDISEVFLERNKQFRSFVVLDIVIIIVTIISLFIISRYLTKPIKKLNTISQEISDGNYQLRTMISSKDEIGELSKSFDRMVENTEVLIDQLKLNVQQREDFMSNFSHELKTPMTAIIGFADLLRSRDCNKETQRMASQYIYQEGKRLEVLSHRLMDLLSLSDSHISLSPISTDILKDHLVAHFEKIDKGVLLDINIENASVLCEETLLLSVLINLIENASKAEPRDHMVHIEGKYNDKSYTFKVYDYGIGMNEETLQHILQPFYMADKSRSRQKGGVGLGLSICEKILNVHNSSLSITSTPNVGTSVEFQLEVDSYA